MEKNLGRSLLTIFFLVFETNAYAETLNLEIYLKKVESENTEILSALKRKHTSEIGTTYISIPQPMLGISQMTEGNEKALNYEISIPIGAIQSISANQTVRTEEFKTTEIETKIKTKSILSDAKISFFNLLKTQEKLKLSFEKLNFLKKHREHVKSTFRNEISTRLEVIKADSEVSYTELEILNLKNLEQTENFKLISFLGSDIKTDSFTLSSPNLTTVENLEKKLNSNLENLFLESSRKLQKAKFNEIESMNSPELTLKYLHYGSTSMRDSSQEVGFTLSIPWLFNGEKNYNTIKAKSEYDLTLLKTQKDKSLIQLSKDVNLEKIKNLKKQIDLLKNQILPKTIEKNRLIQNLPRRDNEALMLHKEAQLEVFTTTEKLIEMTTEYEQMISELEKTYE